MAEFKAGDKVKCLSAHAAGGFIVGTVYTVVEAQTGIDPNRIIYCLDDYGNKHGMFAYRFEHYVEYAKKAPRFFTKGDRVKLLPGYSMAAPDGALATVYDDDLTTDSGQYGWVRVNWDRAIPYHGQLDGAYNIQQFELVAEPVSVPEPTRSDIIFALRKQIGMPQFMPGDVVKDKVLGWCATVVSFDGLKLWLKNHAATVVYLDFTHFEIVTPAKSEQLVAKSRTFKVGDYVRPLNGEYASMPGVIDEDDGDDEDNVPYTVTIIGTDEGDTYDASDLEKWVPNVGERVEANLGGKAYFGTLFAIDDTDEDEPYDVICDGMTDGHDGEAWDDSHDHYYFGLSNLKPTAKKVDQKESPVTFKRGDIVEVIAQDPAFPLSTPMPIGKLAIVADDSEPWLIKEFPDYTGYWATAVEIKHAA